MSRSAFAARFTDLVGEPAMHYVGRWRMQAASTWLQQEDVGLGEMANASAIGPRPHSAGRSSGSSACRRVPCTGARWNIERGRIEEDNGAARGARGDGAGSTPA